MDTGDTNGPPPTSNIPQTAQAYVASRTSTSSTPSPPISQTNGKPKWGGADICPRCGKAVYMAEKMMGGGSVSGLALLS